MSEENKQPLDLVKRRRAAYKTLSEVLQGEHLLRAMWMIEERDQTADRLTFLGIVGVTAEIFGIDNQIISTLYIKLNQNLKLSDEQLPPDPIDLMYKQSGIDKEKEVQFSGTSSSIFRINDIFGVVDKDLDAKKIFLIGKALASEAKLNNCSTMIIARDDRESSIKIAESLAQGITSCGLNVIDLTKVPLPVLHFVIHHFDGKAGVMITGGEHTEPYNGLKMLVSGEMLEGRKIQNIKQRIDNADFTVAEQAGSFAENTNYVNEYIGVMNDDIKIEKTLNIVIAGKSDIVRQFTTEIFQNMNCVVHNPDKDSENSLANLVFSVIKHQADLGFFFDSEGSRLNVIDSEGNVIRSDRLMMLLSQNILKTYPTAQIIHDTQDTSHLAAFIKHCAGLPVLWKNGSAFMQKKLKETASKMAGDMHGHFYFNDRWFGFDDAIYAGARILEIVSSDSRISRDIFSELPKSSSAMDLSLDLAVGQSQEVVDKLVNLAEFPSGSILNIDGMRVDFKNGWMLIRSEPSSSALLLHFEADSDEQLIYMKSEVKQLLIRINPGIKIPF